MSLSADELVSYTARQLNHLFPDGRDVSAGQLRAPASLALDRLENCFKHAALDRYFADGQCRFDHLYSDHYLMYLWFLANSVWKLELDPKVASKLYYLNKVLHGLDCMYDTAMPDIFLLIHNSGTVLGKAEYSDFFVALHGCTVGQHKGRYPVFGRGVALAANSSVIGGSRIGDRTSIGTRAIVFEREVPADSSVITDPETGAIKTKATEIGYAQRYFNVDLRQLDPLESIRDQ